MFWWRTARYFEKSVPELFKMMLLCTAVSFDNVKLNGVGWKAEYFFVLML